MEKLILNDVQENTKLTIVNSCLESKIFKMDPALAVSCQVHLPIYKKPKMVKYTVCLKISPR